MDIDVLQDTISTMEPTMAKKQDELSVLERLKALDEERSQLAEEARAVAMQQAEEAIEILNSLGGTRYHLATAETKRPQAGPKKQREVDPNKPCSVCDFVTVPVHDARKHRSQGENKQPFTKQELQELGLERV